jgi:D-inositol-3-phosphate glycosyltransferase
VFRPGDRAAARRRIGLTGGPVVLFVGRLQPLKGADLAVRALAEVRARNAQLVIVGGPSGPDGANEVTALHALVAQLGLDQRVHFVAPQPHEQLVEYYRAADVCVVPSHTESFGLVALEAAACGTPVVAADVGGLRLLVDDGVTGFLIAERDPAAYAKRIDRVLDDDCGELGAHAYARSMRYRWSIAAARLRRHYDDLTARAVVKCQ